VRERQREPVALRLADDIDVGRGPEGEQRLGAAADLVAAVRRLTVRREQERGVLVVDVDERIEVAGVERSLQQGVGPLGGAGRHDGSPEGRSAPRRLGHRAAFPHPRILGEIGSTCLTAVE
jgi:hypothetical protein